MKLRNMAPVLLLCCAQLQFFSCSGGKTVTTTAVVHDTLTDTAKFFIGKPSVSAVGILVGAFKSDSLAPKDSFYASLCLSSNPQITNAAVTFGSHRLDYLSNQKTDEFFSGILSDFYVLPNVAAANYDALFEDPSLNYACRIIAPYYADTSLQTVSYDTLADSVSLPPSADTVRFFSDSGTRYDSVDYLGAYTPYRIRMDQGLKVTWHAGAQWYGVECRKYRDLSYSYQIIGTPTDTFTSDSSISFAQSYIHQDTAYNDTFSYDFLYIQVIPVSGPPPWTWSSLGSFAGNGYLFAVRQVNNYFTLNAYPKSAPQGGLGKRAALSAAFTPSSAEAALARILSRNSVLHPPR
ncbi:MAG TPA: hypothetical protein VLX68_11130 [Chitinivibrionales bacterium]|nr:hypothetical protein [Chitinivibrionales bacterium]